MNKKLSISQARKRVRDGQLPRVDSYYSTQWSDGAYIDASVSVRLVTEKYIVLPQQPGPCTAGERAK